jgi:hypothetical protein
MVVVAAGATAPPSSGPAGRARLPIPAQIPMALACSSGSGKAWLMIARVPGSSRAAPIPCSTWAPISRPVLGGRRRPARRRRRRPAGQDDALVAVQVADGAAGQHQAGQGDGVAVHHPTGGR